MEIAICGSKRYMKMHPIRGASLKAKGKTGLRYLIKYIAILITYNVLINYTKHLYKYKIIDIWRYIYH